MKPREPRHKVVVSARMRSDTGHSDVCIRNVSSGGMLVQAAQPPPRGSYIEILRPNYSVTARVVWTKDRRFGVQSREKIDLDSFLERRQTPRDGQGTPPRVQIDRRRPRSSAHALRRDEAARETAHILQRSFLIALAVLGAVIAGGAVYEQLDASLSRVSVSLG